MHEILPNVIPAAVSFALIGVAIAIVLEGSLAFLGCPSGLPTPSLGNIINEGRTNNLSTNPYIALCPSLYIFLILLALNLMGDRLRQYFDVREVDRCDAGGHRRRDHSFPDAGTDRRPAARGGGPAHLVPHRRGAWSRPSTGCRSPWSGAGRWAWWASRARARRC